MLLITPCVSGLGDPGLSRARLSRSLPDPQPVRELPDALIGRASSCYLREGLDEPSTK